MSIDFHRATEAKLKIVDFNQPITREDDAIRMTYDHALQILQSIFYNPDWNGAYSKYFGKIAFQAEVNDYKANQQNYFMRQEDYEFALQQFENGLYEEYKEFLSANDREDLKFLERNPDYLALKREKIKNTLKELSIKCAAVDKKAGEIFLIVKNQRNLDYSFIEIKYVSDNKNISNLMIKRRHSELKCRESFESQGSAASGRFYKQINTSLINFVWAKRKKGFNLDPFLHQKYLAIKSEGGTIERYFKYHLREDTPHLFLNPASISLPSNETPTTPGCYIISNEDMISIFQQSISQRRNYSYNLMDMR